MISKAVVLVKMGKPTVAGKELEDVFKKQKKQQQQIHNLLIRVFFVPSVSR